MPAKSKRDSVTGTVRGVVSVGSGALRNGEQLILTVAKRPAGQGGAWWTPIINKGRLEVAGLMNMDVKMKFLALHSLKIQVLHRASSCIKRITFKPKIVSLQPFNLMKSKRLWVGLFCLTYQQAVKREVVLVHQSIIILCNFLSHRGIQLPDWLLLWKP